MKDGLGRIVFTVAGSRGVGEREDSRPEIITVQPPYLSKQDKRGGE